MNTHRTTIKVAGIAICTALSFALSMSLRADEKEEGYKPLGNGKDMSPFKIVGGSEGTWSVDGNVIKCSGKPAGYFATTQSYKNYSFRFDFKYPRPAGLEDDNNFDGNSGYLIHISGEHKVWPKCIEVQGQNKTAGNIFAISGAKAVKAKDDTAARKKALKPVGEWNSMEIISKDGALTAILNGTKVCESEPGDVTEGPIGFQSEGAEIHFRNLRIKESR
jgi:hypothetical protein